MEFVGKVVAVLLALIVIMFVGVVVAQVFGVAAHLIVNGFMSGWDWSWIRK